MIGWNRSDLAAMGPGVRRNDGGDRARQTALTPLVIPAQAGIHSRDRSDGAVRPANMDPRLRGDDEMKVWIPPVRDSGPTT